MSYYPNRLVLEAGHRLVVDGFGQIPGLRLALRPARKRLFASEPNVSNLQVELSKPAFAALVPAECPMAKPILVFETDNLSSGIRDLYRQAGIPVVEADATGSRGSLRYERAGFSGKVSFDEDGSSLAVDTVMQWAATAAEEGKGCLIRNDLERDVVFALQQVCSDSGLSLHHHVPFGYAAGYRPDLPREIARHTIEMTVSQSPTCHPAAPVVLPIRIEEQATPSLQVQERDRSLAEFVCASDMPMAAIQKSDDGSLHLTYSLDGEEFVIPQGDREALAKTLGGFVSDAARLVTPVLAGKA